MLRWQRPQQRPLGGEALGRHGRDLGRPRRRTSAAAVSHVPRRPAVGPQRARPETMALIDAVNEPQEVGPALMMAS